MKNSTVLICDDNEIVHQSLGAYLEAEGIGYVSVYDGEAALDGRERHGRRVGQRLRQGPRRHGGGAADAAGRAAGRGGLVAEEDPAHRDD